VSAAVGGFAEATIRTAAPLALAALGEVIVERAGIINISLEGTILAGAFGALVGATHGGVTEGFAVGVAAGIALAAIFAAFTVWLRADQIITGIAVTLLAVGVTGSLYRVMFGVMGAALSIRTSGPYAVPGLASIPIVGEALFHQPPVTYALYLLFPGLTWWLYRTHRGLSLRAVGESPTAAQAAGIHVDRVRWGAILFGGAMGGVAGAMLVLAQAGTFVEGMSAGRGFIAIAIVVLGRWHPLGVGAAALVFGAATALQFLLQALGFNAPYQLFLALPYLLTLAVLAGVAGKIRAPAALGRIDAL
jgi:ABC-type uncharacterized transport system permease subunit